MGLTSEANSRAASATRSRRLFTGFGLALPVVIALSSCSETVDFDGEFYESVEGVMRDSDGVVRAEIVSEIRRELDSGGNEGVGDYEGGIPMVHLEVSFVDLYGSQPPSTTTLSYLDAEASDFTGTDGRKVEPLEVGDQVILMYKQLDPEERPGKSGSVLVTVGGEDGVMDVRADGTVVPRSGSVTVLNESQEPAADAAKSVTSVAFDLSDVSRLATAYHATGTGGR